MKIIGKQFYILTYTVYKKDLEDESKYKMVVQNHIFSNLQKAVMFLDQDYNFLIFERRGYHTIRRIIKEHKYYYVNVKKLAMRPEDYIKLKATHPDAPPLTYSDQATITIQPHKVQ